MISLFKFFLILLLEEVIMKKMRLFSYITVGRILQELELEGLPLSRLTFIRLEDRLNLPKARRTSGKLQWRVYSRDQANAVKERIKQEYNFAQPAI